jgi:DNA-binding transcriptional LysR family regulator
VLNCFRDLLGLYLITDEGRAYYDLVKNLAQGFDDAAVAISSDASELSGVIRIAAGGAFTEYVVAPIIVEFAKENPEVSIQIDFNPNNVDIINGGFDFAIRYGKLDDSGLIAKRLTHRKMVCLTTKTYLKDNGTPTHPSELKKHNCLKTTGRPWFFYNPKSNKAIQVNTHGNWLANNGQAIEAALLADLGICYLPDINVQKSLASKEVVHILDDYINSNNHTWLVYPDKFYVPLRVKKLMEFIHERIGSSI